MECFASFSVTSLQSKELLQFKYASMVLAWVLSKACCGESLEYKAWDTAPRDARKTPGRHIKKHGNHQRHHSYYDHHSHWHHYFMCVIITTSIMSDCSSCHGFGLHLNLLAWYHHSSLTISDQWSSVIITTPHSSSVITKQKNMSNI